MSTPLLCLEDVGKRFVLPPGEAFDIRVGLGLTVTPREVVAIVGRSGSGKSTLLNLLGPLDVPIRAMPPAPASILTSKEQRSQTKCFARGFFAALSQNDDVLIRYWFV